MKKKDLKKDSIKIPKKSFNKEHKHLVKVLKKGTKKEREKEAEDQESELENEKKETISPKKKSTAIEDRKDNFDRKRSTSNGYMVKR